MAKSEDLAKSPPARSKRGWLLRLVAATVGTALALGALEIGLRLLPQCIAPHLLILFEPGLRARIARGRLPVRSDRVPVERDDHGPPLYLPRPKTPIISADEQGEQRTDDLGFCNVDTARDEKAGIDLIAIGDSFTWCYGVHADEAWVKLLGDRLQGATYSLGLPGNGLYEDVQILKRFGLDLRPQIVVLNVFEGNDLTDAVHYWHYRREFERTGTRPSEDPQSLLPAVTHGTLGRHSYALNLVVAFGSRAWQRSVIQHEQKSVDFRYWLDLPGELFPFNPKQRDRESVPYARRIIEGRISLGLWDEALHTFTNLARVHGFVPVVIYTPASYTAYADRVRFAEADLDRQLTEFSRTQREYLAAQASDIGYRFHDLTSDLRQVARASDRTSLLYDPTTVHLTPAGHAVVARSIEHFLVEQGLAPLQHRTKAPKDREISPRM